MEGDFSDGSILNNQTPIKAGFKNKTGDYICCVCGDNATNYRSVKVKLRHIFFCNRIFSGFMEPPLSATLAEFSSGEL